MFGMLYDLLFFAIPAALVLFFGVSLYRYVSARRENTHTPGAFSPEEMKVRKLLLIISSVLAGMVLVVVVGFVLLLFGAIAFM